MVRGKRTGNVPTTIFFEECAQDTTPFRPQHSPQFTREQMRHLEQVRQNVHILQRRQVDTLQELRAKRRELDFNRFKEEQRRKMQAADAMLEAATAKHELESKSAPRDKSSKPSGSLPRVENEKSSAASENGTKTTSALVDTMGGVSEYEKAVIAHRLKVSQLKMEALARKEKDIKVECILEALPHLTEPEAELALVMAADDEFDVIEMFGPYPDLRGLRQEFARNHSEESKRIRAKYKRTAAKSRTSRNTPDALHAGATSSTSHLANSHGNLVGGASSLNTSNASSTGTPRDATGLSSSADITASHLAQNDPQLAAIAALLPQGTDLSYQRPRSPALSTSTYDHTGEESPDDYYDFDGMDMGTRTFRKKKQIKIKKLKLDDAIAQGSMEGWSTARVRAWNLRHENPNAYYYRFNEPGEVQKNGKWTEAERERFFARMHEVGVQGQWGIFAKEIEGRVGYQCANFYRQMVENNEIEDPRYVIDESGKAHFLFSKNRKALKDATMEIEDNLTSNTTNTAGQRALEGMTQIMRDGRLILIPIIHDPKMRNIGALNSSSSTSSATKATTDASEASSSKAAAIASNPLLAAQQHSPTTTTTPKPRSRASRTVMSDGSVPRTVILPMSTGAMISPPPSVSTKKTRSGTSGEKKKKRKDLDDSDEDDAPKKKKVNPKKRKRGEDADDAEYRPSSTWTKERAKNEASAALKSRMEANPLPGFKDVITNSELIQPAISPYGHVLSYSTWVKCLASIPKNTCPFTKKPIKKRDLIMLTWENIDSYRDRIDRSGQS